MNNFLKNNRTKNNVLTAPESSKFCVNQNTGSMMDLDPLMMNLADDFPDIELMI